MTTSRSSNLQTVLATSLLAIGLLLVAYMVTVEGELGALPLGLVLVGAGWLALARWHARRHATRERG